MSKAKSAFFCQNCGHETPKWLGKCPSCKEWNTFVEERTEKTPKHVVSFSKSSQAQQAVLIQEVQKSEESRISLQDFELNRVLGGGIVPGSINLLGGDPGIGKSTLLLQLAIKEQLKVLYVSGEESVGQVRLRAERTGAVVDGLYLASETDLASVLGQIDAIAPNLLVVDSVQTIAHSDLDGAAGMPAQIREVASNLIRRPRHQRGRPRRPARSRTPRRCCLPLRGRPTNRSQIR